jgi:hypothetical protein
LKLEGRLPRRPDRGSLGPKCDKQGEREFDEFLKIEVPHLRNSCCFRQYAQMAQNMQKSGKVLSLGHCCTLLDGDAAF